jgi:hypothetical protein
MVDSVYTACIRFADLLRVRWRLALLVGLPLFFALSLAINRFVLFDFPNSGDEYVYLYQAQTMAAGRLWNQAPSAPDAFLFTYIAQEGSRIYGTFPFGWPLVLTLALLLRMPVVLVNPLLGCLTVVLAGVLGRRLYGPRAGVWAALVVGTMPFVLFNAASYFSHTFCGAALLAAGCLATGSRVRWFHSFAIGVLIAWAVLARYYTGVICGVPIVLLLLRRPSGVDLTTWRSIAIRRLALVVCGGLVGIAALAAYNQAINGSPWRLTTQPGTFDHWFKSGFVSRGGDILANHILRHVLWTPPALVFLYVAYLWGIPRERRVPLDWMLVATAVTLFFYLERGGNQYGARFHYEAFLFATVFVCGQLFRRDSLTGASRLDRRAFAAFAMSLLLLPFQFVAHAVVERRVIRERMDPFRQATEARLSNAVVFMKDRIGTARPMRARDLTRNGLTYDGPILYAIDADASADCEVMTHYPGRSAYRYVWNVEQRKGDLTAIDCVAGPARSP